MTALPNPTPPQAPAPLIGTLGGAEDLLGQVTATIDKLTALVEEETRRVRQGALFAASDLQAEKSQLAATYVKLRFKVRENAVTISHLPQETIQALSAKHEAFASLLKTNMSVLATAREVAEGIVKNVATAVGRSAAPHVYGSRMRIEKSPQSSARGISVDRRL
ncbi:MAG: hypothetical protein P4L82_08600 [Ancalomicrobiaceae bacterium]|nr:hypothetical protein [Ancalomicrobiaceae bacterium]